MLCVEVVHSTPWAVFMEDDGDKESCLLIMSFSAVARPCVALSDQSRQEHGRELLFFIVAPYLKMTQSGWPLMVVSQESLV